MFTPQNLKLIFPTTAQKTLNEWVDPLNKAITHFDIDTRARACAFIAQVGHESAGLTATSENLNYSAEGLRRTFPKYFPTDALAQRYARNPRMIASRVYANRMGNRDEASGDGWLYRGRGLIQVTGANLYAALAHDLQKTVAETVLFLETKDGAAMSAGWYWDTNSLNALADATRFTDLTKRVNGGVNGLQDRKEIWGRALKAIA
jgi:putative chitinase